MMADDLVGKAHARETQEEYRKVEVWDRFEQLAKDIQGDAVLVELFRDLVFRHADPESVKKLVMERL